VVWNTVTFLLLAAVSGRLPGEWEVTEGAPGAATWVLGFFALIGVSWIWQLIWTWFGREDWIVSRNRLDVRRSLLGLPTRRVFTDSDLQLERLAGDAWFLYAGAGFRRRSLLNGSFASAGELSGLFDLAELLSARTGWRLRAPERPDTGALPGQPAPSAAPAAVEAVPRALDAELRAEVAAELDPDERLFWVGRPDARRMALQAAPALIFAIPWTLFSLDFLRGRDWDFDSFTLMPALFALFGVFMCCTPGVIYFQALRTTYAVTDRRVLILVRGKRRKVESYGPSAISGIERKELADESGDLVFARRQEKDGDGGQRSVEVKLVGIPRVREVERLLRSLFQTPAG
jgi:hypothetical protein